MFQKLLHWRLFKCIAMAVLIAFVSMIPAQSGYAQVMPKPGEMVYGSNAFNPTLMIGLRVDLKNPFNLYFAMSNGEEVLAEEQKNEEYTKLIKYFMASLITPNSDMWVNLSPKEADRIIPDNFSMTEMGRDLLAQDYLLKQFTASLISPDTQLGKKFWDEVYKKTYETYGTTDIPIDTFNKVWIMADKADIYQKNDTALLVGSHLKVMLEQDLMALETNKAQFAGVVATDEERSASRKLAADIVRTVIVPVIEKEVNEGSNFAQVRQAYNSMILATWFKKTLKDSLLGQVYADQNKVAGIALDDPQAKDRIYEQYLQAYKTGVFDYIKEELDEATQQTLSRKYFSGGMVPVDASMIDLQVTEDQVDKAQVKDSRVVEVSLVSSEGGVFTNKGVLLKAEDAAQIEPALDSKIVQAKKNTAAAYQEYKDARGELERLKKEGEVDHAQMSKIRKFFAMVLLAITLFFGGSTAIKLKSLPDKITTTELTVTGAAQTISPSGEVLDPLQVAQSVFIPSKDINTTKKIKIKDTVPDANLTDPPKIDGDPDALADRVAADERWSETQQLVDKEYMGVIASFESLETLHTPVKMFKYFDGDGTGQDPLSFFDFQYGAAKPSFEIYRIPSADSGPIDYTTVLTWERIIGMDVKAAEKDHKNFVVVVKWMENGDQQKQGILWSGAKAAVDSNNMIVSAFNGRVLTNRVMEIMAEPDINVQHALIFQYFGSLGFRVDEFNGSLTKAQELMNVIGKDANITVPTVLSVQGAVDWLNTSTDPFAGLMKLKQDNKLSVAQLKAIDVMTNTLSISSRELFDAQNWTALIQTPDGQRFKRALLESLYSLQAPKSPFNITDLNNTVRFGAVKVKRDVLGNVTGIEKFYELGTVTPKISAFDKSRVDLVLSDDGHIYTLRYWPFSSIPTYSLVTPEEEALFKSDPTALDSFNDYSNRRVANQQGEIILGKTFFDREKQTFDIQALVQKHETEALQKYQKYLHGKRWLSLGIASVNLLMQWPNDWWAAWLTNKQDEVNKALNFTFDPWPIGDVANLVYDGFTRPDLIMQGRPSLEELSEFFGKYNYLRDKGLVETTSTTAVQDTAWDNEKDQALKDKYIKDSLSQLNATYSEADMQKMFYYLEHRKDVNTANFFIGKVAAIMPIMNSFLKNQMESNIEELEGIVDEGTIQGTTQHSTSDKYYAWKSKENAILSDIFTGKFGNILTGEINPVQLGSLALTGDGFDYLNLRGLTEDKKPLFVQRFFSVVGGTFDAKAWINWFAAKDDPLKKIFPSSPTAPRINVYVFGYPLTGLEGEIRMVNRLVDILDPTKNPEAYAYKINDGVFRSTPVAFSEKQFENLFQGPGSKLIPAGKVHVGGTNMEVPIYMISHPNPKGGAPTYEMYMLTAKGLDAYKDQLKDHLTAYESNVNKMAEGGWQMDTAYDAGGYNQNNPSGLYESHSTQGPVYSADGYTWDQMLVAMRAMVSGQPEIAKKILARYQEFYDVAKASPKGFAGFTTSFNVNKDQNSGWPTTSVTAMVGNTIMTYAKLTGLNTYDGMLEPIAKYLSKMQNKNGGVRLQSKTSDATRSVLAMGAYTEPNALVYSFLANYSIINDHYKNEARDSKAWLAAQYDDTAGLFHYGENKAEFSADAQTRTFMAFGPEVFTREIIKGTPADLLTHLKLVDATFGVHVIDQHTGYPVDLLDIADKTIAGKYRKGGVLEIGFPEVTSEFVMELKYAKVYLTANNIDTADIDKMIDKYTKSLDKMSQKLGGLPQATVIAPQRTGFGASTATGDWSLGPRAYYELAVKTNENIMTPALEGKLDDKITQPSYTPTENELMYPQFGVGEPAYAEMEKFVSDFIRHNELHPGEAFQGKTLKWADLRTGQEIVYVDENGLRRHLALTPSVKQTQEYRDLIQENNEIAQQMAAARAGEPGPYANGGVIFTTPDGSRIGGVRGSEALKSLIELINTKSVQEQAWIMYKNFGNFSITMELDGKMQEVIANAVFPLNKPVTFSMENKISHLLEERVFVDGRLSTVTDANGTTTFHYNDSNKLELSTTTVGVDGVVTDETTTLWAKIIDPHTIHFQKDIDTKAQMLVKRHVNKITGTLSVDTYGLFSLPMTTVTEDVITENVFDEQGFVVSSRIYNNNGTCDLPEKGAQRFENVVVSRTNENNGAFLTVRSTDVQKNLVSTIVFDSQHFGRKVSTSVVDKVSGKAFNVVSIYDYDDKFHGGQVAAKTHVTVNGRKAQTFTTTSFNPATRMMTAELTDYQKGGATTTLTWQPGQENPASSVVKDNQGNIWKSAFEYDRNEMNFKVVVYKNGVVATTSTGRFVNKLWVVNETKWFAQGRGWKQESSTITRSAFGTLLGITTHYVDGIDRQYVPAYNNNRVEIGGSGLKYDLQKKKWINEFAYSHYAFNRGNMTRTKVELLNGSKSTDETFNAAGLVIKEVDMQTDGGRRVITYDYKNSLYPSMATSGTSSIVYADGKQDTFITSRLVQKWEHNGPQEAGVFTLELTDHFRGTVWYEDKDVYHRNRLVQTHNFFSENGDSVPVSEAFAGLTTKHEYKDLALYDVPFQSSVQVGYVVKGVITDPQEFKTSEVVSFDPATGRLTTIITNHKLGGIRSRQIVNNYNQMLNIQELDKNGAVLRDIDFTYGGLTRLINMSLKATTLLDGLEIDRSWLTDANGRRVDQNIASLAGIFLPDHSFGYRGQKTYRDSFLNEVKTDYHQIRNGMGDVRETQTGRIVNDKLVPEHKNYAIFDARKLWTLFGVADKTVSVDVAPDGRETIVGYANNTDLIEGDIFYKVKQGVVASEIQLELDKAVDKYAFLRDYLFINNEKGITFAYMSEVHEEMKDAYGRLTAIFSGALESDDHGFPVRETSGLVTFLTYPETGDDRLASSSASYNYQPGKDYEKDYRGAEKIVTAKNMRLYNAKDINGVQVPVVAYDTGDTRLNKNSIANRAMRLDNGNVFAEYHKNAKVGKEKPSALFFDRRGFPDVTYTVTEGFEDALRSPANRMPKYKHYVALINPGDMHVDHLTLAERPNVPAQHGFFFVWNEDIRGDRNVNDVVRMEDGRLWHNDLVDGKEISPEDFVQKGVFVSDNVRIMSKADAEGLAQRNGTFYDQDNPKFTVANRNNPEVWRDYRQKGPVKGAVEYLNVQFDHHVGKNSLWANIKDVGSRGAESPAIAIILLGVGLLTLLLPGMLLVSTGIIGFSLNKIVGWGRKKKNAPAKDKNLNGAGGLGGQYEDTTQNNDSLKVTAEEVKLRARLALINRHLNLIESYTQYLLSLYKMSPQALLDHYYPDGHALRQEVETALIALGPLDQISEDARNHFIEKYFIVPIVELVFTTQIDQGAKLGLDLKAQRPPYLDPLFKQQKQDYGYYNFTDRDLRHIFEYCLKSESWKELVGGDTLDRTFADLTKAQEDDPITRHGWNKFLSRATIATFFPDTDKKSGWEQKNEEIAKRIETDLLMTRTVVTKEKFEKASPQNGEKIFDWLMKNGQLEMMADGVEPEYNFRMDINEFKKGLKKAGIADAEIKKFTEILKPRLGPKEWLLKKHEGETTPLMYEDLEQKSSSSWFEKIKTWFWKKTAPGGWTQPVFPIGSPSITAFRLLGWGIALGSIAFGLLGLTGVIAVPIMGSIFVAVLGGITGYQVYAMAQHLKFRIVDWTKAIWRIIWTAHNYKYNGIIKKNDLVKAAGQDGEAIFNALKQAKYLKGGDSQARLNGSFEDIKKLLEKDHRNSVKSVLPVFQKAEALRVEMKERIITKKRFYYAYLGTWAVFNTFICSMAIYFTQGLPVVGWIAAVGILAFTWIESIRSFFYLFTEGASAAQAKNKKLHTIKSARDFNIEHVQNLRNSRYWKIFYEKVFIDQTLQSFHLADKTARADLLAVINEKTPEDVALKLLREAKLSEQGQEEIKSFFNKMVLEINLAGGLDQFHANVDGVDLEAMLPIIFKGTGKKRILPALDFLDGELIEGAVDLKHELLYSGFEMFKGAFEGSFSIFVKEDLLADWFDGTTGAPIKDEEETINSILDKDFTLRATADAIFLARLLKGKENKKKISEETIKKLIESREEYIKELLGSWKGAGFKDVLESKKGKKDLDALAKDLWKTRKKEQQNKELKILTLALGETQGSLKFQVDEFDDLPKVQALIKKIGKDADQPIQPPTSVEDAVKWLNDSTDPFTAYNNVSSLEFRVAEFDSSLAKAQALIDKIGKDAEKPIEPLTSVEEAVSWLNNSTEPFTHYSKLEKLKKSKKLSTEEEKALDAIDAVIKTLGDESKFIKNENWDKLVKISDGQKLKRAILENIYPTTTPKSVNLKAINAVIEILNPESKRFIKEKNWDALVNTLEGQWFKRLLLETIYPSETPKNKLEKKVNDGRNEISKGIIKKWVMYRADGYLKTLEEAERAGEATMSAFLEYRYVMAHPGVDLTLKEDRAKFDLYLKEELPRRLMFIHVHEDIDPDLDPNLIEELRKKASETLDPVEKSRLEKKIKAIIEKPWSGEEPQALIDTLGPRGYVLNQNGNKVIVSTKDYEKPEGEDKESAAFPQDGKFSYPKEQSKLWEWKTDKWSICGRFIEQRLVDLGKQDAVIFNLDRDHFFTPTDFMSMPLIADKFLNDERLGFLTIDMKVKTGYVSPAAADHALAEDVWNRHTLAAESEFGTHAFYGPGIVRWNAMRRMGAFMSNIEDTAGAHEALMLGFRAENTPRVSIGRPREMIPGSIPAFQNRFGGLVLDEALSTSFQKVLDSDELHWTEKATLVQNFDFYVNKPLIPRYNLLIFVAAFFLNFTPFSALSWPLIFVGISAVLAEAITAGGVRELVSEHGLVKGLKMYGQRMWSLVFSFGSLVPLHDEKVRNAHKGAAGIFSSGIKDIMYPRLSFSELYGTYRTSIYWGILLSAFALIAPFHPIAVVTQIFFYIFPVAFIFGPFMKNGKSNPWISGPAFIALAGAIGLAAFGLLPLWGAIAAGSIFAGCMGLGWKYREKYMTGIAMGLMAIPYAMMDFVTLMMLAKNDLHGNKIKEHILYYPDLRLAWQKFYNTVDADEFKKEGIDYKDISGVLEAKEYVGKDGRWAFKALNAEDKKLDPDEKKGFNKYVNKRFKQLEAQLKRQYGAAAVEAQKAALKQAYADYLFEQMERLLKDSRNFVLGQKIWNSMKTAFRIKSGGLKEFDASKIMGTPALLEVLQAPADQTSDAAEQSAKIEELKSTIDAAEKKADYLLRAYTARKDLEEYLQKNSDSAQKSIDAAKQQVLDRVQQPDNVGGINLSDEHLTINIKVDGAGMPLPAQFQDPSMVNIKGLSPVIRDISTVNATNMPVFAELLK